MQPAYKRVVIKISGEALAGENGFEMCIRDRLSGDQRRIFMRYGCLQQSSQDKSAGR